VPTLSGAHHLLGLSALAAANLHLPLLILLLVYTIHRITLSLLFSAVFSPLIVNVAALAALCGGGAGGTSG
jgi:uncharacterized integral membrane protein